MKTLIKINIILNIILIILLCVVYTTHKTHNQIQRDTYITDKFEKADKTYLILEVEVNPDEYIGYDIGDSFIF